MRLKRSQLIIAGKNILKSNNWEIGLYEEQRKRAERALQTLRSPVDLALREMLKRARRTAGLKQAPLAIKLGWPQSTISMIESSGRGLEAAEFITLALAIGADPRELMGAAMEKAGVQPSADAPPTRVERSRPRTQRRKGRKPK